MIQQTAARSPNTYRIDIQGDLTAWKGRLGALRMSSRRDRHFGQVTSLSGQVQDQAELFGILNTIYELHLPLLLLSAQPSDIADEEDDVGG